MIDFPEEKIGSIYEKDSIEIMVNKAVQQNKFFYRRKMSDAKSAHGGTIAKGDVAVEIGI